MLRKFPLFAPACLGRNRLRGLQLEAVPSALVIALLLAMVLSPFAGETTADDCAGFPARQVLLSFVQEYEASNAAAKLLAAIGTSRVAYDVRRASMPGEPRLTELAGVPAVAPECTALEADDFVAPGAYREDIDKAGTLKFQCCIHPWLRLEAKAGTR